MTASALLADPLQFSAALYERMAALHPGIHALELYEFRYGLDNLTPAAGWASVLLEPREALEACVRERAFFEGVKSKPERDGRIVLDETITRLAQMLFVGLVSGDYPLEWIERTFYFDVRAFVFLPRTEYLTPEIVARFGGKPYRSFEPRQAALAALQDIGYRELSHANREIDGAFIQALRGLIVLKGTPVLVTLVGPTAAGKSEIAARIQQELGCAGVDTTTVEMDNFFKDRAYRDSRPMGSEVIHYELFKTCMTNLLQGRPGFMPRYDFVLATSSHDPEGRLRPGQNMIEIKPAGVILLEGNFPFHLAGIAELIGIKALYLTDDPLRLKRKWRRDVDYRKKYDPRYLVNRFFRTQFLRAQEIYRPMMQVCELVVDTTRAQLWLLPELAASLD